jgi:hypothetical protein
LPAETSHFTPFIGLTDGRRGIAVLLALLRHLRFELRTALFSDRGSLWPVLVVGRVFQAIPGCAALKRSADTVRLQVSWPNAGLQLPRISAGWTVPLGAHHAAVAQPRSSG